MKRYHGNTKVYIIQPQVHGNGGWCGQCIIEKLSLAKALKFYPHHISQDSFWGDNALRICIDNNIDTAIFKYDIEECTWIKV